MPEGSMVPGAEELRMMTYAGVVLGVLGLFAIIFPFLTSFSITILVGVLMVFGGVIHVANAFSAGGWKRSVWQVVLALVYLFAGVSILANPVLGLTTLTILLVAYLLVSGIVEIVMGLRLRGETNWVWTTVSGVVSLLLAGLLWVGFPSTAAWAIGLLFGFSLLTTGVAMVLIARGARRTIEQGVSPPMTEAGGD